MTRENKTATIRPGGHRLPELDGLRAWAIVAVLFSHLGISFFIGGGLGVDLFFVLSGFLITHLLLREFDRRGSIDLLAFYRRRAWRLLPALVVMLILVDIAAAIQDPPGGLLRANLIGSIWTLGFAANWTQEWIGSYIHLWSLGIEEQFYIFWAPIVILLVPGLNRCRAAVVLLVLGILDLGLRAGFYLGDVVSLGTLNNATYTHVYGLMIGAALAMALTREGAISLSKWSRWLGWLPARDTSTHSESGDFNGFACCFGDPSCAYSHPRMRGPCRRGRSRRRTMDRPVALGSGGLGGSNFLFAVPLAPSRLRRDGLHGVGASSHGLGGSGQGRPVGDPCGSLVPSGGETAAASLCEA